MEGPGMSIFNGGGSIKLNTSDTNLEEEQEEVEDQKRRKAELHKQLENAFDDLADDHDDTIDESSQYNSGFDSKFKYHKPIGTDHTGGGDSQATTEILILRNKLESKTREFQHVTELLTNERKQFDGQLNDIKKRFALAEAEKERANMTRQQTHELLVESKAKISNQDDTIEQLKLKNKTLEHKTSELIGELESTKTMLNDVQLKYSMVEKTMGFKNERSVDSILKSTNERHKAQIEMMQQQIDSYRDKYEDKMKELKHLEIRYNELQRTKDALLIEKSESLEQLARNLEEAQRRNCKLLEKPDYTNENLNLQQQCNEMQKTITVLSQKLEKTSAELEFVDSLVFDNETSPAQANRRKNANLVGSTPLSAEDRLGKLRNELLRSLDSQKEKRVEIKKLQEIIQQKDNEIKKLRTNEDKIAAELETLKENSTLVENKLKQIEKESFTDKTQLHIDFNNVKAKLVQAETEIRDLNKKKTSLMKDLTSARNRVDQLEHELRSKEAKNSSNICKKCVDSATELAKFEIEYLQLQNSNSNYLNEINSLKLEIENLSKIIKNLNKTLDLKSERDKQIEELKQKAQQFEEMIRIREASTNSSNSTVDVSTSPIRIKSRDQSVATSPEMDRQTTRELEKNLRQEFARGYANQLKTLENKFKSEMEKYEIGLDKMRDQIYQQNITIDSKTNEVEILKKVILAERAKMTEILSEQHQDTRNALERNNELLQKSRTEIENSHKKLEALTHELHEKQEQIDSERQSMAVVMKQWSNERVALTATIEEYKARLKESEDEYIVKIKRLEEKYQSAKNIGNNYKTKAENSEKHYFKEFARLKEGYAETRKNLELKMEKVLRREQARFDDKLEKIEKDYQTKLKLLVK